MPALDFGELVEYVTEGPVYHHVALDQHDWTMREVVEAVLEDYVKVFRITARLLNLDRDDLNTVIPAGVRTRINTWLANRGYQTIPAGWTYKQLLVAIRSRVAG